MLKGDNRLGFVNRDLFCRLPWPPRARSHPSYLFFFNKFIAPSFSFPRVCGINDIARNSATKSLLFWYFLTFPIIPHSIPFFFLKLHYLFYFNYINPFQFLIVLGVFLWNIPTFYNIKLSYENYALPHYSHI